MHLDPADERRHRPCSEPGWQETWWLQFAAADASLAGVVTLTLIPETKRCVYTTSLVGAGRDLVSIVDVAAPLPRPPGLELRTTGLWVDPIIQTPWAHVTLGLEAFGVALDDPADAVGRAWGDRTPVGLDLEWETLPTSVAPVVAAGADTERGDLGHATVRAAVVADHREAVESGSGDYAMPCLVHGEVLLGDEEIDLDARGWRGHSWGVPGGSRWTLCGFDGAEPWIAGGGHSALDGNGLPHGAGEAPGPAMPEVAMVGVIIRGKAPPVPVELRGTQRAPGLVTSASLDGDGRPMTIETVGWAPVPDPGHGASMHVDRVLVRGHRPGVPPAVAWLTR